MSKNYSILNAIAGLAIALCVSIGFQSCGNIDNPLEEIVNTVSEKTGLTPAQVSALIEEAMSTAEVQEAIGNQTPITVEISGGNTSSGDKTITIPMEDPVGGKKLTVELKFTDTYGTSETNPLVLKASEGAGDFPGESNNNLVVTMPPSEGLAITIELPETTVTLKTDGTGAVVYKDVIAKTAKSTIIIDKGVTIKEHELVGGNIVVNDGGAIETLAVTIKDNDGMICLGSWWSGVGFKENGPEPKYEIKTEDGGYYIPKNVRIKKGTGDHVTVWTNGPDDEYIEKLIIGEGVTISLGINSHYKVIMGEGENKAGFYAPGWIHPTFSDWNDQRQETVNGYYFVYDFDTNTEKVSNVSITEKRGETNPWNIPFVDQQTAEYTSVQFDIDFFGKTNGESTFTFENCAFPANSTFNLHFTNFKRDANGKIVYRDVTRYCCFYGEGEWDITDYPTLADLQHDFPGMTTEVGDRERGGYWTIIREEPIEEECENFTCTLIFKNCTINGSAISPSGLIHSGKFGPGNVAYKVKIDNPVYSVIRGAHDDDITLTAE